MSHFLLDMKGYDTYNGYWKQWEGRVTEVMVSFEVPHSYHHSATDCGSM